LSRAVAPTVLPLKAARAVLPAAPVPTVRVGPTDRTGQMEPTADRLDAWSNIRQVATYRLQTLAGHL